MWKVTLTIMKDRERGMMDPKVVREEVSVSARVLGSREKVFSSLSCNLFNIQPLIE